MRGCWTLKQAQCCRTACRTERRADTGKVAGSNQEAQSVQRVGQRARKKLSKPRRRDGLRNRNPSVGLGKWQAPESRLNGTINSRQKGQAMWKHEVINVINRIYPIVPPVEHLRAVAPKAVPFFFGEAGLVDSMAKKTHLEDCQLLIDMPYDLMIVEWIETKTQYDAKTQVPAPNRAILIEYDKVANTQTYYGFYQVGDTNLWWYQPYALKCDEHEKMIYNWVELNIQGRMSQDKVQAFGNETLYDAVMSQLFIKVLNCRNIVTKTVTPSNKRNTMRKRQHKLPYYEYKIIEVTKEKTKQKDAGPVPWGYKSPEEKRFHYVRGHIKTYTEESKLCGKTAGSWWWQPHARGNKTVGVIEKEYHVKKDKE